MVMVSCLEFTEFISVLFKVLKTLAACQSLILQIGYLCEVSYILLTLCRLGDVGYVQWCLPLQDCLLDPGGWEFGVGICCFWGGVVCGTTQLSDSWTECYTLEFVFDRNPPRLLQTPRPENNTIITQEIWFHYHLLLNGY